MNESDQRIMQAVVNGKLTDEKRRAIIKILDGQDHKSDPDLLTITETKNHLRCSRPTVYPLIEDASLNPIRIRGLVRIKRDEVEALAGKGRM